MTTTSNLSRKDSYILPSRIIRSARKKLGLTQSEVARKLSVSQSLFSKFENGVLIPDMVQWTEFCMLTKTSMDSHMSGVIDDATPVQISDLTEKVGLFKIPKRYSFSSASKVRTTTPFLKYFESKLGREKVDEYINSVGMDQDYFVNMDSQLNINFSLDLTRMLIQKGEIKKSSMRALSQSVSSPSTHGILSRDYDRTDSRLGLIQALIANSKKYEANCNHQLEEYGNTFADISSTFEKHMKDFKYNDDVLGDFICRFRKNYFTQFTTYRGKQAATIEEKECVFHGASKCVYHLEFAS